MAYYSQISQNVLDLLSLLYHLTCLNYVSRKTMSSSSKYTQAKSYIRRNDSCIIVFLKQTRRIKWVNRIMIALSFQHRSQLLLVFQISITALQLFYISFKCSQAKFITIVLCWFVLWNFSLSYFAVFCFNDWSFRLVERGELAKPWSLCWTFNTIKVSGSQTLPRNLMLFA